MRYTKEKLQEILRLHKLWLTDDPEGERADLSNTDLRSADLRCANLSRANLRCVALNNADLSGANLRCVDLRSTDLSHADLRCANLDFSCWPLWCGSTCEYLTTHLYCLTSSLEIKKPIVNIHHRLWSYLSGLLLFFRSMGKLPSR